MTSDGDPVHNYTTLIESWKANPKETFGGRVKRLRICHMNNITQEGLAKILWLNSRASVNRLENADSVQKVGEDILVRVLLFLNDSRWKRTEGTCKELVNSLQKEIVEELETRHIRHANKHGQ